ncbi:hypothetical protein MKX07_000698, partial [Trichoderma sp. CBMAI-0711]
VKSVDSLRMDFSARRICTDESLATGSDDIKLRPRFSDTALMKSHINSDRSPGSCESNDVGGSCWHWIKRVDATLNRSGPELRPIRWPPGSRPDTSRGFVVGLDCVRKCQDETPARWLKTKFRRVF